MTNIFQEDLLVVSPWLAVEIGLNEAIFLHRLHSLRNWGAGYADAEGRYWIRSTLLSWRQHFPFWSISTIQRIIKKLEEQSRWIKHCLMRSMRQRLNDRTIVAFRRIKNREGHGHVL